MEVIFLNLRTVGYFLKLRAMYEDPLLCQDWLMTEISLKPESGHLTLIFEVPTRQSVISRPRSVTLPRQLNSAGRRSSKRAMVQG